MATAQVIHQRAFVNRRAVAYCKVGSGKPQPTTSPDPKKVTCTLCQSIRAGRT